MLRISVFIICYLFVNIAIAISQEEEMLQLKKYTFDNEEQLKVTDKFLKKVYLPALRVAGFTRIGVFKEHEKDGDTSLHMFILLPVKSSTDLHEVESSLIDKFPDEKHYARVENIILKSFSDMPQLSPAKIKGPRKNRIYELRSYESYNDKKYKNKVEMFNEGGEINLFEKLGFNAVFYAEVLAGSTMPNLMYMTTHENREVRAANWKSFVNAAEWKAMSSQQKYQDNVSHIDIHFLYPTEYSDY